MVVTNQLHLPSLSITGFRGIEALSIPRLGRVTLLAGKNGVGKTTVLEAVRLYASRAQYRILRDLLTGREEFSAGRDEDDESPPEPDWEALFYGRDTSQNPTICIGPTEPSDQLMIDTTVLADVTSDQADRLSRVFPEILADESIRILRTFFQEKQGILPGFLPVVEPGTSLLSRRARNHLMHQRSRFGIPEMESDLLRITCESLGPGLLGNPDMARFWDKVALTDYEDLTIKALSLIFGSQIEKVAMIGEDSRRRLSGRRIIIRVSGYDHPVPLKSLGDGALRMFGVALALANSRDGFLVIDEAENGIHHSVQKDFWRIVLETAQKNNVQVIATTHSWDCIQGFAQAATELEDAEGVLVRLSRQNGDLRAITYSEKNLMVAVEQEIEVR